jgi:hypothetical protein
MIMMPPIDHLLEAPLAATTQLTRRRAGRG